MNKRLLTDDTFSTLASQLLSLSGMTAIESEIRQFPDGEYYIRIDDEMIDSEVVILWQLHRPEQKVLPLLLLVETLRDLGAAKIGIVAPYLPYMRQDKRFRSGEGITAHYFAHLMSQHIDWLVTVDPHLHRIHRLDQIYTIPTSTQTAVQPIATWIRKNVSSPIVVGPDSESEQWAANVAVATGCPFEILQKERHGDRDVEVSLPHIERYANHVPVLVDDIISTGRTMLVTADHLRQLGLSKAIAIGVHGVFGDTVIEAFDSASLKLVTSNSIPNRTSKIDLSHLLLHGIEEVSP